MSSTDTGPDVELEPWDDVDLDETLVLAPEPAVASSSLIADLKAQRATMTVEHTLDLDVPGWRGKLVLRFGAVTPDQQRALIARLVEARSRARSAVAAVANIDLLIAAYRCALARAPDGELAVIPGADGEPAGLKELVVDVLELGDAPTARAAMRSLYAGANSPEAALQAAGTEWNEWATEENEEVDERFMGES
jgi:hypothetical protein